MRFLLKILMAALGLVLAAGLLGYAFHVQILTGLARWLIVDDALQPADLIYLLNGEVETRPFHAAQLFEQGLAASIVTPREEDSPPVQLGLYPNGTEVSVRVLQELGVPAEQITVLDFEGGVTSTFDEAVALRDYVTSHPVRRIIIVTSALHTRRTRWIFERQLAGSEVEIQLSAAPQYGYDATNWWLNERGLRMVNEEYVKLLLYRLRY